MIGITSKKEKTVKCNMRCSQTQVCHNGYIQL